MPVRPLLVAQLDAMHQSRGGDWYYRSLAPGRALAELDGVYVVTFDQAHRRLAPICERADVLIINGVCSADLLPLIAARKLAKRPTVFEINDDVEHIQPENPLAGFFGQPQNLRVFRRIALSADAVQYSVPELERLYGALNPRGRVLPNQLVSVPPLALAPPQDRLRVGWGGSAGHFADLAEVAPALTRFVLEHPGVSLHLMCSDRIWQLFDALPSDRKQRTPTGSIDEYYRFVAGLDVGIAPNLDKGFNRARSDVKFLEFAAHGAVAVVQRLTPYLDSVQHGLTGLMFEDAAGLVAALERLLRQPEERLRLRQAAYDYVATERRQRDHAAERLAFYDQLCPASTPAPGATELFEELTRLEGAEVAGRHLLLSHARFETLLHDGLLLMQQPGGSARGAELLRQAAQLEPQSPLPELFLGVQLQQEDALVASLAKNPRSVQALLALGELAVERGQLRSALERFLAAAELAPGYELPFAHAAAVMQKLGASKEAAEFEQLAQQLARAVAAPARRAAPVPAPKPATSTEQQPAWRLLDQGVHLTTLDPSYAPSGLLELIQPAPRRVLDLGCFCGGTGRWLKRRFPGCHVVGIEMLERAAAMAAEAYDQVLVGTLESLDLAEHGVTPGSFDAIVAADVLEHMFNPWQALLRLRPLLAAGGALYVSLPNVRNLKLLSDLARGHFDYAGAGILDVTHVRFFTRKTAVEMLEQTGFVVDDVRINPDQRLAAAFEGKNLNETSSIELDGLSLSGLAREDLLELCALQLYVRARVSE